MAARLAWAPTDRSISRHTTVSREDYHAALAKRQLLAEQVSEHVPPGTVLAFPTVPGPAPLPGSIGEALEAYRARSISMLCTAGLTGLPQLTLPLGTIEGMPFGLSLLGWRGSDRDLLVLGQALMSTSA